MMRLLRRLCAWWRGVRFTYHRDQWTAHVKHADRHLTAAERLHGTDPTDAAGA